MFTLIAIFAASLVPAAPQHSEEVIFPMQSKHVHSSSIVETPNGDLLCAWFHGSGERTSPDVFIEGARKRADSDVWSPVFPMADTPNFPDCNPVLFIDKENTLWLFWIAVLAERWEESLLRCRKAQHYEADGPPQWDWQDDIILKPGDEFAKAMEEGYKEIGKPEIDMGGWTADPREALFAAAKDPAKRQRGWMPRAHALTLPSGRILLPLYSDGYYVGLMAISDDTGKTWRASSPIVGIGLNQPSVVRQQNGDLVAYMREEGEGGRSLRVQAAISKDDGETWSVARPMELPNPNASVEAIALADHRWALVYNDTEEERNKLAISLSDDEGATWKWTRHLENAAAGEFSYPSLIQTRDGVIHVTYTYRPATEEGKAIKHATFNAEWIMAGD